MEEVKLRTLKDLPNGSCRDTKGQIEYCVYVDRLRQEAIKWVKYIYEKGFEEGVTNKEHFFYQDTIWIKHFFNITEDDLNTNKEVYKNGKT